MKKVLIGCECSGVVRDAFRAQGFNAWSCDVQPSDSDGQHIQRDLLEILNDGWDLLIAHPPCTDLSVSGARWFENKMVEQRKAIYFFLAVANAPIKRICIENPVGIMSTFWRQPDQIIQPYYFGDSYSKTTCLWLKNLPALLHHKQLDLFNDRITHVERGPVRVWSSGKKMASWLNDAKKADKDLTSKIRSKTFPGIANQMATQWGDILKTDL